MERQKDSVDLKETCAQCGSDQLNCACKDPAKDTNVEIVLGQTDAEPEAAEQLIDGKYQMLELIGDGGMGCVYKAKHLALNKFVAVKLLRKEATSNDGAIQRFDKEAKATSALVHNHLCAVHDYGLTEAGAPYLVMDYLEGTTLADVIEKDGRLSPERVIDLCLQIGQAVGYAHGKGVVHRDLKPCNIMIESTGGTVKVLDFGIAKILPQSEIEGNSLTQTGEIFGSPLYMSPEQCVGQSVDERSDIYSLGCVMYEMLSGVPPLTGENPVQTILLQLNKEPEPFAKILKIPPALEAVVFKCLAKQAKDRYGNIYELLEDLERVKSGRLKVFGPGRRVKKSGLRWLKISAAAIGVILVCGVTASHWSEWFPSALQKQMQLASADMNTGIYDAAESEYNSALTLAGSDRVTAMNILSAKGDLYKRLAEKGEPDRYIKSYEMYEKGWDLIKDNPEPALSFNKAHLSEGMGECQQKQGAYEKAEPLYDRALKFRRMSPGAQNRFISTTRSKQAQNYFHLGQYDQAEQAERESLSIEEHVPAHEAYVSFGYHMLGDILAKKGELKSAVEAYDKAIRIRKELSGPDAPEIAELELQRKEALHQMTDVREHLR